jgi:hypothetical protein
MKKALFFLIILFFVELLQAQTDFKPGYVISIDGDTLYGEIDYRGDILMGEICKFRNSNREIIEYSPNDISAYRFIESKYYVSKEVKGKKYFLKYLIKAKISVFYLRADGKDHYFIEKENEKIAEIPYSEETKDMGSKRVINESTIHIGVLKYYTKDAPQLIENIQIIKKPNDKNLIKLVKEYQNIVSKNEKYIVYEENLPLFKLNTELSAGFINYDNINYLNDKYFFIGGFYAHIGMPKVNEKLFFRTGFVYSPIEVDNRNFSVYKIPIQIEYIYPKAVIRPKFALGFNVYPKPFEDNSINGKSIINPVFHSFALMGGLNLKLKESIYLSINYDVDFKAKPEFAFLPEYLLSNQLLVGIFFKIR